MWLTVVPTSCLVLNMPHRCQCRCTVLQRCTMLQHDGLRWTFRCSGYRLPLYEMLTQRGFNVRFVGSQARPMPRCDRRSGRWVKSRSTRRSTVQHVATQCNTSQHSATRRNTWQRGFGSSAGPGVPSGDGSSRCARQRQAARGLQRRNYSSTHGTSGVAALDCTPSLAHPTRRFFASESDASALGPVERRFCAAARRHERPAER